jgi:hypothetical protein
MLYFFGYSNVDEDSYSNFYHWDEHTTEHRALHNGFKLVNAETMKEVLAQPKVVKHYVHNNTPDMVPSLPKIYFSKVQEPGLAWAKSCLERQGGQPAALGVKKQEV